MKNNIESIIKYLKGSNDDFIVTSHISPDGDNIGSTLSMYYALNKLGKNVYYVLDDNPPQNLKFLVENMNILKSEEVNLDSYNIVALDCGDKNRICISQNLIDNAKKIICIDHHASNDSYGSYNYVVPEASSTCELVYNLLMRYNETNNTNIIDKNMATSLYTGLMTDTGKFSYSNTQPSSFDMAKNLLIMGAEMEVAVQNVFGSNPFNFYKLLGEALNTLEITNTKIATMSVTQDMMERNSVDFKDIDGVTPYARDIENVEIGILLKQKGENEIKVSLRSKSYADVSKIAATFGGGGHIRAAGCTIKDTIENAKKKLVEEALKEI